MSRRRERVPTALGPIAGALTAVVALVGCGSGTSAGTKDMSAEAQTGASVALSSGCSSCHGTSWAGGVGPAWVGLAGSTVTLSDGSTVVADTSYLTRAIHDPSADRVKGYSVTMPKNSLSDDDIAAVVAFIEELPKQG